jgi:transcriptional regulator with XRE-family HTH domain
MGITKGGDIMRRTIRALREARSWSQNALAIKLGVTPGTVYSWERGRNEPKVRQLRAIAELFGVSMDDIELIYEDETGKAAAAGQVYEQGGHRTHDRS